MILAAMALAAAIQSNTTCNTAFGTTTCHTMPTGMGAYDAGRAAAMESNRAMVEAGERAADRNRATERELGYIPGCASGMWLLAGCSRRQHDDAVAGLAAKDARAALRVSVTQMLASDDCPGAIRAALAGGDMDLAREARDFCRP